MKIRTILALAGVAALSSAAMAEKDTGGYILTGPDGNGTNNVGGVNPTPADFLVVDVTGIESWDGFGDPDNTVLNFNLAPNAHVIGVSWDVEIEAFSPSWLSEMRVDFTDSGVSTGVSFAAGAGDNFPGVGNYAGSANLVDLGLDFNVGADGVLRFEFWESFNDFDNAVDGVWNSGNITVEWVPAPGSLALLGLGGLAAIRRRR